MMEMPPLPPMPEPDDTDDCTYAAHSCIQMEAYARSYGELCARMAREEAARIAEDTEAGDGSHDYNAGAETMSERIAAAIRKL